MRFNFLIILSLILLSCSDDTDINQVPFAGKWQAKKVTKDGVLQPDWANLKLFFDQSDANSGKYSTTNTVNDSIWNKSGTWAITNDLSKFIRDDTITVYHTLSNDTLFITKQLPWTVVPCTPSVSNPCTTGLGGQWNFVLIKD